MKEEDKTNLNANNSIDFADLTCECANVLDVITTMMNGL
jgi:hypothetical protein